MKILTSKLKNIDKIKLNIIPIIIIVFGIALYNYEWDIITSAKIYSMGASVFDLGVFYQSLWITLHNPALVFISNLQSTPINFFLAPLALSHNMFFFVHLQTFWISFTAIPLYFIVLKKLKSRFSATLMSLSFLIFFGLTGINWFDIHRQSLFIPLFISGYALLIYDKNKSAIFLIVLSGLVRFPYIIFPLILSFTYLIENIYYKNFNLKDSKVYYYIFFISLIFLGISIIHISAPSSIISEAHGSTNYFNNFKGSLDNKIFTMFLFLAPFFMLPVLSKRWLILMVPFFFLSIFSGYPDYAFPNGEFYQYYSAIIPFLYLGFIDVLSNLEFSEKHLIKNNILKIKKHLSSKSKIVVTTFIIIILLALFYQPYGPFNNDTSANFNLQNTLDYNVSQYNDLNAVVNLIPKNEPYILYQDNMPEVNFRDPQAQLSYVCYFSTNYTYNINNHWVTNINYILIDSNSVGQFLSGGANNSIYTAFNHFILSGKYGIKVEESGILLLERNYSGSPVIYSPLNYTANYHNINNIANGVLSGDSVQFKNLYNKSAQWNAELSFMQPGNYNISIVMNTTNNNASNYFNIDFNYLYEKLYETINNSPVLNITGKNITRINKTVTLTIPIHVGIFMDSVTMKGLNYNWNGTLNICNIRIAQTSP